MKLMIIFLTLIYSSILFATDPQVIDCPKDTWVRVATKIKSGQLIVKRSLPQYVWTYRLWESIGDQPIVSGSPSDINVLKNIENLSYKDWVNIYVKAKGKDGSIILLDEVSTSGKNIQYVTNLEKSTRALDLYFTQTVTRSLLSTDATIDATFVLVDNAVGFTASANIEIYSGLPEDKFYHGTIINKVGNTVYIDTPIDYAFSAGSIVDSTTTSLNIDGSAQPQIFTISACGTESRISLMVTRIMINLVTTDPIDLTKFGDIAGGIVKGVVLRKNDGEIHNMWNIKTNADISLLAYDTKTFLATNPGQGVNGLDARNSYAGESKHGAGIKLLPCERLEIIIQDDLSSLLKFRIMAQGHVLPKGQ